MLWYLLPNLSSDPVLFSTLLETVFTEAVLKSITGDKWEDSEDRLILYNKELSISLITSLILEEIIF